jgi:hypothetical protein
LPVTGKRLPDASFRPGFSTFSTCLFQPGSKIGRFFPGNFTAGEIFLALGAILF